MQLGFTSIFRYWTKLLLSLLIRQGRRIESSWKCWKYKIQVYKTGRVELPPSLTRNSAKILKLVQFVMQLNYRYLFNEYSIHVVYDLYQHDV